MQSVTCGAVGSQACNQVFVESELFSSSSSELFSQGRNVLGRLTGCSRSVAVHGSSSLKGLGVISIARPLCGNARAGFGVGLETEPRPSSNGNLKALSRLIADPSAGSHLSSEQRIYDTVAKQASMLDEHIEQHKGSVSTLADHLKLGKAGIASDELLAEAYARSGEVCAEYAKTFFLGTKLMTPERQRAIWAIYVWCRRTDELVDGPNASRITPTALNRWEERLEDIFRGQPFDMLDAALADTVVKFPVDIQPFRDMIDGMRMDLVKSRYNNFDELYLYCYNVAGTVGLMSVPVMGIAPDSKATTESVYSAALALGIANQLTNILRDVGEDARRHRVYLPQDELARFGLSDEDIFAGVVTDKWRAFMKDQIRRARMFFNEAETVVGALDKDSRWPVWASLILYRQILDSIEANDYNNFTKRAYVGKWKKFVLLPAAYGKAVVTPSSKSAMSLIRA